MQSIIEVGLEVKAVIRVSTKGKSTPRYKCFCCDMYILWRGRSNVDFPIYIFSSWICNMLYSFLPIRLHVTSDFLYW